jgi:DNA repair protein RecO (recombination protein O)
MMRALLTPAYVLHRRPYRDSSLIIEVMTAEHGRFALVARGARRPKAKLHGLLQPFTPLLLSWSGRGEMGTLNDAEGRGLMPLQGRTLISGFYLNELLMKLLARHDAHALLFDTSERALRELALCHDAPDRERREQRALRLFEKILLDEIGYGLVLDHEVAGGTPIRAGAEYDYHPDRGPVDAHGATGGDGALRLRGSSLIALARGTLDDECLREVRALMRMAIGACLAQRPLHSRALFRPLIVAAGGEGRGGELP